MIYSFACYKNILLSYWPNTIVVGKQVTEQVTGSTQAKSFTLEQLTALGAYRSQE